MNANTNKTVGARLIDQWWRGRSRRERTLISLAIVVALLLVSFVVEHEVTTSSPSATSTARPHFGVQSKTTGCIAAKGLPDAACTPGAIFPQATTEQICTPGYARSVRDVSQSLKDKVYAAYGIQTRSPGQYEVDHLVSLQLGGSNDIANLWPEAATPVPGFHEKDRVENYLHDQLCAGALSLQEVQAEIATNWLAVYKRLPAGAKETPISATPEP